MLSNKQDQFKPDIVIAIARGGYVPARILCDRLDIYNLTSIRIAHYTGGSTKLELARLSIPLGIDIKGMQVLLVDDVTDTGDTSYMLHRRLKRPSYTIRRFQNWYRITMQRSSESGAGLFTRGP